MKLFLSIVLLVLLFAGLLFLLYPNDDAPDFGYDLNPKAVKSGNDCNIVNMTGFLILGASVGSNSQDVVPGYTRDIGPGNQLEVLREQGKLIVHKGSKIGLADVKQCQLDMLGDLSFLKHDIWTYTQKRGEELASMKAENFTPLYVFPNKEMFGVCSVETPYMKDNAVYTHKDQHYCTYTQGAMLPWEVSNTEYNTDGAGAILSSDGAWWIGLEHGSQLVLRDTRTGQPKRLDLGRTCQSVVDADAVANRITLKGCHDVSGHYQVSFAGDYVGVVETTTTKPVRGIGGAKELQRLDDGFIAVNQDGYDTLIWQFGSQAGKYQLPFLDRISNLDIVSATASPDKSYIIVSLYNKGYWRFAKGSALIQIGPETKDFILRVSDNQVIYSEEEQFGLPLFVDKAHYVLSGPCYACLKIVNVEGERF